MPELENRLRALGADVAFPPTPALREDVVARLEPQPRVRRLLTQRRLVLAVAVVLAVFAAVLAVSPGARSAFLELFRIKGAVVYRVETLPAVAPTLPPGALGERVSRDEAQRRVGFDLVEPQGLGRPDAVYVKAPGIVTFVYGRDPDVRLVFSQVRGTVDEVFYKKVSAAGTSVEPVRVGGGDGLFVTGEPHGFYYVSGGVAHQEPLYLARDTLLWERGPLTLRLEGELTLQQALELAGRIR